MPAHHYTGAERAAPQYQYTNVLPVSGTPGAGFSASIADNQTGFTGSPESGTRLGLTPCRVSLCPTVRTTGGNGMQSNTQRLGLTWWESICWASHLEDLGYEVKRVPLDVLSGEGWWRFSLAVSLRGEDVALYFYQVCELEGLKRVRLCS